MAPLVTPLAEEKEGFAGPSRMSGRQRLLAGVPVRPAGSARRCLAHAVTARAGRAAPAGII